MPYVIAPERFLATEKQVSFLRRLQVERPSHPLAGVDASMLERRAASAYIDTLMHVQAECPSAERLVLAGTVPERGTFTVVMPKKLRCTVRFATAKQGSFAGKIIVKELVGSDNETSYAGVGHVVDGGVQIWQKARKNVLLLAALKVLLRGDHAKAGEAYAIESSHCWRCGKLLTVPVSIGRGLGPECAWIESLQGERRKV